MTEQNTEIESAPEERGPRIVNPTSRVNVALPFGNISLQEASRELVELVEIVAHLVDVVGHVAPGPQLESLRERVDALAARVH